jgi:hypothetical protein
LIKFFIFRQVHPFLKMIRRFFHILILMTALATVFLSCGKTDEGTAPDPETVSYGVSGTLRLQKKWTAVYIGRYDASAPEAKNAEYLDRLSAEGTGSAMYFHVIAKHGSLKGDEDILDAFRDGTGVGKTMGGKALVEWFKALVSLGRVETLSGILACGGPGDANGYMDYTIGNTGTFDVYVVEMLPNGHISGRYGLTTLEISGEPVQL